MTSDNGPQLTLMLVHRGELNWLELFLRHHSRSFDEIVVVDYGDNPRSLDMAFDYTDNVFRPAPGSDLAGAYNLALDGATGDWIVWLEIDEWMSRTDLARLRESIEAAGEASALTLAVRQYSNDPSAKGYVEDINAYFSLAHAGHVEEPLVRAVRADADAHFSADPQPNLDAWIAESGPETLFIDLSIHAWPDLPLDDGEGRRAEMFHSLTEKIADENPDSLVAHWQLAAARDLREQYEESSEALGRALALDPDNKLLLQQHLLRLLSLRKIEEAEAPAEHAVRLFGKDPLFLSVYGEILTYQGLDQDAFDIYSLSLSINPQQFFPLLNCGLILMKNNDPEDAIPVLERASQLQPANDIPFMNLGVIHAQLRENPKALDMLEQALKRNDQRWQTHFWLAQVYGELGEKKLSEKHRALSRKLGEPEPEEESATDEGEPGANAEAEKLEAGDPESSEE